MPIVIHPDQPDLLFLSAGVGWPAHWYKLGRARGKIFRSRDAGKTWERLLGGLPNGQRATVLRAHHRGMRRTATRSMPSIPTGRCSRASTVARLVHHRRRGAGVERRILRGLRKDRVMLATVDDIEFNPTAAARIGATKIA